MLFENTVGKGEIDRNEQFLLFPQCFLPLSCHFYQICSCRLETLSVWKSLEFVVWERFKSNAQGKSGFVHLQKVTAHVRLNLFGFGYIVGTNTNFLPSLKKDLSVNLFLRKIYLPASTLGVKNAR